MPATNYYNDFIVVERDADGNTTPLVSETLDIYLASDDSLLGDVTTDDYGQIYGAGFSLAEGTVIYFDYKGAKFYQTLYETIEIAETKNLIPCFIAEDSNTNTTEAKIVEIWMENTDEPAEPRIKAGEIDLRLGTSLKIPVESFYPKNYKFTALAKTDGGTYATTDFNSALSANFAAESASANDTTLINNFLPSQSGNANESLVTDGTNVSWQPRVSSVGFTLPSIFSVTGSPVTSSGTIAASLVSQSQNLVFASPNGSSGTPTFRALVSADIPNLDAAKITSGTIATARLGSGTANSSTYLRGDGSWQTPPSYTLAIGNAISSGTNDRIIYQSGGNLAQSGNFTFASNVLTLTGREKIINANANYDLAVVADTHLLLDNSNGSGQNMLVFAFSGSAVGGVRADYVGNFNWHASGYQQFYCSLGLGTPIMNISSTGVYIGGGAGATGSTLLDVNANKFRVRTAKTPSSAGDTGNTGDICWDSSYIYVCVSGSTWKRASLATW